MKDRRRPANGEPSTARPGPPVGLRRLLERAVPRGGASGDSLAGDLYQEYAELRSRRGRWLADLWYAGQVAAVGLPFLAARGMEWSRELRRGLTLDLRHTLRGLRRNPGLSAVACLSLALGIGMSTTSAGIISGIWFAPLPYPAADRLVELEDTHPVEVCEGCSPGTSWRSFQEWREGLPGFESMAALSGGSASLTRIQGERPRPVRLAAVSRELPGLLDLSTRIGRGILPEDDRPGAQRVVVLGHPLWTAAFAADPGVLGETVQLDGVPHTVVGVLAEETRLPDRSQALVALAPTIPAGTGYGDRGLWVLGRPAEGVSLAAAHDAVSAFASARYAAVGEIEEGWSARARPLAESLAEENPPVEAAVALQVATLLVLLIACVNLASLLLARMTERERELGIRVVLGSSRSRLLRFAALESVVLAATGGVGGLALAWMALDQLALRTAGVVPGWITFGMDPRVVGAALALTLLTASLCAFFPLLAAREFRTGGTGARLSGRRGRDRLLRHDWLLGAQVALGLLLLAGTGKSLQTFARVSNLDTLGFRTDGMALIRVALPEGSPADPEGVRRLREVVETHPATGRVAEVSAVFLGSWGQPSAPSPVHAQGAAEPVPDSLVPRHSLAVGPGYLGLLEIPLLAGREITDADGPGAPPAAVLSRDAARVLFPGAEVGDIPGRGFTVEREGTVAPFTVVGVAGDVVVNYRSESRTTMPRIYLSRAQTPDALFQATPGAALTFQVEARGALPGAAEWEALLQRADPEVVVEEVSSFEAVIARWSTELRLTALVSGALAALALGLLVLGVYGTLSYRVATQRFSLGLRVALGAEARELVRVLTARVARILGVALGVGAALALAAGYAVPSSDLPLGAPPGVVAAVMGALVLVCAAACVLPLRRALRVDPMESLRAE